MTIVVVVFFIVAAIIATVLWARHRAASLPKSPSSGERDPAETSPEQKRTGTAPAPAPAPAPAIVDSPPVVEPSLPAEAEPQTTAANTEPAPTSTAASRGLARPDSTGSIEIANLAAAAAAPSLPADSRPDIDQAKREKKLQRLHERLATTRSGFVARLAAIFSSRKELDPKLLEELEETLLTADVGAVTTEHLTQVVRDVLDRKEVSDPEAVFALLKNAIRSVLTVEAPAFDLDGTRPFVIMVVGVNGAGKTTTIGKLASRYVDQGRKVVLAAGDTFRAAAVSQLEIWGRRTGSEVIKGKEGADPSSVVFDAIKHAKESGADVVICDTAGRLHTQQPLMEELKKVRRVMSKIVDSAPHEILLVLDATTGQNALQQTTQFHEALGLTGLVLTKLDGTTKGGVIIGICQQHKLPIRFIGIGEAKDDLREFETDDFVEALFARDDAKIVET